MTVSEFVKWLLKRIEEYLRRPIAGWIIKTLITGGIGILSSPWWVPLLEAVAQKTLNITIANTEIWGLALIAIGLIMYVIKFEISRPRILFSTEIVEVICTSDKIITKNSKTGEVLEGENKQNEQPHKSFRLYINIQNDSDSDMVNVKSFASLEVQPDPDSTFTGIKVTEEDYQRRPIESITIKSKEFIRFDVTGFLFIAPPLSTTIKAFGSQILFGKTFIIRLRSEFYSDSWFYRSIKKKFYSDYFQLRFKIVDSGSTPFEMKIGFEYLGEKSISYKRT